MFFKILHWLVFVFTYTGHISAGYDVMYIKGPFFKCVVCHLVGLFRFTLVQFKMV